MQHVNNRPLEAFQGRFSFCENRRLAKKVEAQYSPNDSD